MSCNFVINRHPSRSAEVDLCWQAAGRWAHPERLQHPEGEYSALGAQTAWWWQEKEEEELHHPKENQA